MDKLSTADITPEQLYRSRRAFLGAAGALSAAALLAACGGGTQAPTITTSSTSATAVPSDGRTDELGQPLNRLEQIAGYNNYYEFTTDKEGVDRLAAQLKTSPWEVQVAGLVDKPRTFSLEELLALGQEERIYRLRCVEAWSMVIPWRGFPLRQLLEMVQPQAGAKFVRFETLYRPEEMPGQRDRYYPWPYVEGLRLDEAMHDLTLLATGIYGKPLTPQNGAPLRLVVPWKYGFKSIKAIAKIDLVDQAPTSLWMALAPNEYGFYANVNPEVDHPRWSQASERRIGELRRRPTLPFNGYADQVASLYAGMDLREHY